MHNFTIFDNIYEQFEVENDEVRLQGITINVSFIAWLYFLVPTII